MPRHAKPTPPRRRSPSVALAGAAVAAAVLFGGSATAAAIVPVGVEEETTLLECKTIEKPAATPSTTTPVKPSSKPDKPTPAPGKPPLDTPPATTAPTETPTEPSTPSAQGDGTSIADIHNWGTPHESSDEFDQAGRPDAAKWNLPGAGGWVGHDGNGRRVAENSSVADGALTLRGDANGDTGWIFSKTQAQYGRWEIRMRSENTGTSGPTYHPLFIGWGVNENWPIGGELDVVEYTDPGGTEVGGWLHYPHDPGPVQQEGWTREADPTEWHVYSFEWSKTGLKIWMDGELVFDKGGGATSTRRNLQDADPMSFGFQLDNFHGSGMRPATQQIDYYRYFPFAG